MPTRLNEFRLTTCPSGRVLESLYWMTVAPDQHEMPCKTRCDDQSG